MKTSTMRVSALLLGLAACASGSPPDLLTLDSGTSDPDAASQVVIVGAPDSAPTVAVMGPTGAASSTSTASNDAAADEPGSSDTSDDAGGFGTGSDGYDAGSDEDYDAGYEGYDAGSDDNGSGTGSAGTCKGYASPDTPADCYCDTSDPSKCQANGCYGGYYCDTYTTKCKADAPSGC